MQGVQADESSPPLRSSSRLGILSSFSLRAAAHPATIPLLLAIAIGLISSINHFQGVDWGDDFALYMRQAKAIAIGNIGEVLADNRFVVDNSGWHTFSPYSYPWGWPLIVSPVYAVLGLNYEAVKLLEVIALCTFVACYYALTRRRLGAGGALLLTLVVGLSPAYVGWTDTALSDLPYLAFVGVSLWWMDRCRARGLLGEAGTGSLVILGLLIAYAFNIRREGVVLLVSLAALHLVLIVNEGAELRSLSALRRLRWKKILTPYITFFASVVTFHLLLPTVMWPRPVGAGLHNLPERLAYFREVLAEQIGINDPGETPMSLLNSEYLGNLTISLLAALAVAGMILRLANRPDEDVALAAYLCGTGLIVGMSPYQEGRYLLSITPFLLYFAYQALPALAGSLGRHKLPVVLATLVSAVFFAIFLTANARDLVHSTRYHMDYDFIVNGPESPSAQEMFAVVREQASSDDVILFFRARAMTLYTDRRAIQGSNLEQLLPRVGWYAMAKGSTYSQRLLTDDEAAGWGLTKTWENDGWVLWKAPPS